MTENCCPLCTNVANFEFGRFRDLTQGKFDNHHIDHVYGMVPGVKITCSSCGEINIEERTWMNFKRGVIAAAQLLKARMNDINERSVIFINVAENKILR